MKDIESPMIAGMQFQRALGLPDQVNWPWLNFPDWMQVQIQFPYVGAAFRFRVRHVDNPKHEISIYFDVKSVLGCMSRPYFEAYPIGDDAARFYEEETEELMAALANELLSKL